MNTRTAGLTNKVYEITNNFETYLTTDFPSQHYQAAYIAHCMHTLKMPLSEVRFTYKEHTLFYTHRLVTQYGKRERNTMEVHRKNQTTNTIWITKVDTKEQALRVISIASGYSLEDVTEEINITGYWDDEYYSYEITHDKVPA